MRTLLNNVQAIQQGIAMVANDPALKFNDITKLLGELITATRPICKIKKITRQTRKNTKKDGFIEEI